MLKLNKINFVASLRRAVGLGLAACLVACGGGGGSAGAPINGGDGTGTGGTRPTVSDMTVQLDRATVANNGDGKVEVTVTTLDASRVALANVPVAFAIDNGGIITVGSATTNASGVIVATASIGSDRTNRTIKVTATSGSISKQASFDIVDSVTGGKVAALAMLLDRASIPNDGSQTVQLTVTSLDANRAAVGGSPVNFKLVDTADAFLTPGGTTTDASTGNLTATIRLGTARLNRPISVIATSGTVQQTVSLNVVDPIVNTTKQASEITVLLDKTAVSNSGSEFVTATVTALDNLRNVLPNIPVTFSVDANANVTVLNGFTNSSGQAKAEVRIGSDKVDRLVTLTIRNDQLVKTVSFRVTGSRLQATLLPALPDAGSVGNKIEYRLSDINQVGMPGISVIVTGPGSQTKTGTTNDQGIFVHEYTAPSLAGTYGVKALAAGVENDQNITVPSGAGAVPEAVGSPSPPNITLSPSVVRVNSAIDSSNTADVRVIFIDKDTNKPIPNMRVKFDLPDPNSVGGSMSTGSTVLYSDVDGAVISKFVAGTRASPTNGVHVRACYSKSGTPDCTQYAIATLTVVSDPLSVTLGTNAEISVGASSLTYVKQYVVLVVDSAGNPRADVQINPVVDLTWYRKGFYSFGTVWTQIVRAECVNEDTNRNGIIDTGEDVNFNGQLDPRKSDVAVSLVGSTKTDANGQAILKIEYPQSFGSWTQFKLSVTASGVLSPPATLTGWLPVPASALTNENSPPAFVRSPYGVAALCSSAN